MATTSAWFYSHEVYNFHLTDIKIEGKKMREKGTYDRPGLQWNQTALRGRRGRSGKH